MSLEIFTRQRQKMKLLYIFSSIVISSIKTKQENNYLLN